MVQVIGCLISKAFGDSKNERTDTSRDSLLTILLERYCDIHAYTRSRVLQVWSSLFRLS